MSQAKPPSRPRLQGGRLARRSAEPSLDENVVASKDGSKLYVSVGSNSNVGETAWRRNRGVPRSGKSTAPAASTGFSASGLRNPNGHGLGTGERQAVDSGERARRDRQLTRCRTTSPRSRTAVSMAGRSAVHGQHVDVRVTPQNPDLVAKAIAPALRRRAAHRFFGPDVRRGGSRLRRRYSNGASSASMARGSASRTAATR